MTRRNEPVKDVMMEPCADRRFLPHVPDPLGIRHAGDRRSDKAQDPSKPQYATYAGQRYTANFEVRVTSRTRHRFVTLCSDISQTGMRLRLQPHTSGALPEVGENINENCKCKLDTRTVEISS